MRSRCSSQSARQSQRGSALLFYILVLPVLLLLASLAIDISMMYIAQAQLQAAVDGAAHGAVRLLETDANTTEIAGEYLRANMPSGYWFTSNLVATSISYTTVGNKETVAVSAKVDVPLTFLRLVNQSLATVGATGSASKWNLIPCSLSYPYGSAPAKTSVPFSESQVFAMYGPTFVSPHGSVMVWYNDEHPITLGVYKVTVKTKTGTTITDYSASFTPFTGTLSAANPNGALPVGTTSLTGDQAGTDTAMWNSTYGYQDYGRPLWPAVFLTDITANFNDVSGDWQQGGQSAVPPSAIYGSWKGATRLVDRTKTPAGITVTPDADPKVKYNWTGVPDIPPGGFPKCDGYCSEVVWSIDTLGLLPGHTYRMQFIIHDGDQNQSGGDTGQGCALVTY